ncbi:MAG: site-2 protease family protein [Pseudomonadota bacterium]
MSPRIPLGILRACMPTQMLERGSMTLLRVHGVPVKAHWTLLLILPYLAVVFSLQLDELAEVAGIPGESLALPAIVWGTILAIGLFASVAIHELAHTMLTLRSGGSVHSITLMVLGGVSQVERMPTKPRLEAAIAAVGPSTSLALAGILMLLYRLSGWSPDAQLGFFYLGYLNLVLGIFNFLPAFPMDGGRVLRALLVRRFGVIGATEVAVVVGKAMALLLGVLGALSANLLLLLVAVFIYFGADAEVKAERARESLGMLRVHDLLPISKPGTISIDEPVAEVLPRMREVGRLELVVVDNGEPTGVIDAEDLEGIELERRSITKVRELGDRLTRRAVIAAPDEPATAAIDRANSARAQYLLIVDKSKPPGETLVGLLGLSESERVIALRLLDHQRHGFRLPDRDPSSTTP